ncbi:thiamine diphosphokinase [Pseudoroseicyclus sp. CLL3-39]|uniref:Thiamine diphosphokinase n=1 Tax=Pseudoroseicyclus tamaricis TaxID=2705421 RepID=A0A6B2JXP6_9RHOB|nr:thiamine diphosphokinase [Pseudoroseicyclus tamaricis]
MVSSAPVTLVGGGPVSGTALAAALRLAPRLVAADGGADRLLAAGHRPEAVIGDMDSISPGAREVLSDRLIEVSEQETTDFDKALRHIEAPLVLALGMRGGRLDHELAALSVLAARPDRPCVLLGEEYLACLCPPELRMDLPEGSELSLFPLAPCRCESDGLLWPTAGLDFAIGGRIGTSNAVTGPVWLKPDRPAMLLILPQVALEGLVRALPASPAWPSAAPAR